MSEYDFFETPVNPFTVLVEGTEVVIHIRSTETMEQGALRGIVSKNKESLPDGEVAKLNCYGRLGARINDAWYIQIIEHMEDDALATDHNLAQSMDIEQSLKSPEQFKKSRYRNDKEG